MFSGFHFSQFQEQEKTTKKRKQLYLCFEWVPRVVFRCLLEVPLYRHDSKYFLVVGIFHPLDWHPFPTPMWVQICLQNNKKQTTNKMKKLVSGSQSLAINKHSTLEHTQIYKNAYLDFDLSKNHPSPEHF